MSLLGSVIQGAHAAQRHKELKEELANLPEYEQYSAIAELSELYENLSSLSEDPYSASSTAGFNALLDESTQSAYQNALRVDPTVSGSVLAGMNTSGLVRAT